MFGVIKAIGLGITAAIAGVILAIVGIFAIFFFAIIGAVMGAITGLIVSMVPILGPLVIKGFGMLGFVNIDLTAVGAALGFVAGFFKSTASNSGNNNAAQCNCDHEAKWSSK